MNSVNRIIGGVLLFNLINTVNGQCHFIPYRNKATGDIMGLFEVKPFAPKYFPLLVQVVLEVDTTSLPVLVQGELKLANTSKELSEIVEQRLPIFYKIYFPKFYRPAPIPRISKILLNGNYYCDASEYDVPPYRSVTLENYADFHPLTTTSKPFAPSRPSGPITTSQSSEEKIRNDVDFNPSVITPRPRDPTSTARPTEEVIQTEEVEDPKILETLTDLTCGLINPAIGTDDSIPRHKFPWLAAVFVMEFDGRPSFRCTGSLLSNRHVLTAGGCLKDEHGAVEPTDMVFVSFGRFDVFRWNEPGSVTYDVDRITIHPDYNNVTGEADLAVIKVAETIDYTLNTRPLCLWAPAKTDVGVTGYVIGWSGTEAKLQLTKVLTVPQVVCSDIFSQDVPSNTFCARRRKKSDFCYGQYTGGTAMITLNPTDGRYNLRGIVSSALGNSSKNQCDYNVYVDTMKYSKWLYAKLLE